MKKLLSIFFFCSFFVLLFYFLFQGLENEMLSFLESREELSWYCLISFLVLSSDIFMPVPSSLVMILNGKILGIFLGTVLSTTSGLCSSIVGFYLGRKSGNFVSRFFSEKQQERSRRLFMRYGRTIILFSKALPVVSESIAFISGTSGMSFRSYFWLSFLGHLGISLIYAYLGDFSASINSSWLSAAIIFFVLLIFWVISKLMQPKEENREASLRNR